MLELVEGIVGFYVGKFFVDLGVDVVKLEFLVGDCSCCFGLVLLVDGALFVFLYLNTNKCLVVVDFDMVDGVELVLWFIVGSDVVIESLSEARVVVIGLMFDAFVV